MHEELYYLTAFAVLTSKRHCRDPGTPIDAQRSLPSSAERYHGRPEIAVRTLLSKN